MSQKITAQEKEELQSLIEEIKQQAIETARQSRVDQAQMTYLQSQRWIAIPAMLAWKIGCWLGLPLLVVGWVIGEGDIRRAGLLLFAIGAWLLVVAFLVLLPGFSRVTRQAREEVDRELSEVEKFDY